MMFFKFSGKEYDINVLNVVELFIFYILRNSKFFYCFKVFNVIV